MDSGTQSGLWAQAAFPFPPSLLEAITLQLVCSVSSSPALLTMTTQVLLTLPQLGGRERPVELAGCWARGCFSILLISAPLSAPFSVSSIFFLSEVFGRPCAPEAEDTALQPGASSVHLL